MSRPVTQSDKAQFKAHAEKIQKEAVISDDPEIWFELACGMNRGRYYPHDNEQAYKWIQKCIEKSDSPKYTIGLMPFLILGMGTHQDLPKAIDMLEKLIEDMVADKHPLDHMEIATKMKTTAIDMLKMKK
jgi:hypothetical protein